MLTADEREAVFKDLEAMAAFLARSIGALAPEAAMRRGSDDTFSPVEQCWHLADLEVEGHGVRIRRLLNEERPSLPDFEGARIAAEREYRKRSHQEGLRAFEAARRTNIALLRSVPEAEWARRGVQDGVGEITLADVPCMMREHDASHRAEIVAWCVQANEIAASEPFTIRRASATDAPGIVSCLELAFEPYRERYTAAAYADTVLSAKAILERMAAMSLLVAVTPTGEIIGTVGCRQVNDELCHIRGMAVHPDFLGHGVAQQLLERGEAEVRSLGCSRISLNTTEPLQRAIRFYERNGFRLLGTLRDFFGMPLREYIKAL